MAALAAGPGFTTDGGAEADVFARLHAQGRSGVWLPGLHVHAPEPADEPSLGARERVVDGWILRSRWQDGGAAA
jgi:hypothetical protein